MDTKKIDYETERVAYYKVLGALLVLTTVTFIQPYTFLESHNFSVQLMIGGVKAWIILMYYMHLKGDTLIGWTVGFAVALVVIFFTTIISDVNHFQFKSDSHITSQPHIEVDYGHEETSHEE